jgi:hypothetical protein
MKIIACQNDYGQVLGWWFGFVADFDIAFNYMLEFHAVISSLPLLSSGLKSEIFPASGFPSSPHAFSTATIIKQTPYSTFCLCTSSAYNIWSSTAQKMLLLCYAIFCIRVFFGLYCFCIQLLPWNCCVLAFQRSRFLTTTLFLEECYWELFYLSFDKFSHKFLTVILEIANNMGLQTYTCAFNVRCLATELRDNICYTVNAKFIKEIFIHINIRISCN